MVSEIVLSISLVYIAFQLCVVELYGSCSRHGARSHGIYLPATLCPGRGAVQEGSALGHEPPMLTFVCVTEETHGGGWSDQPSRPRSGGGLNEGHSGWTRSRGNTSLGDELILRTLYPDSSG
ncbi:hypothetical protein SRHO_G00275840 [Serrasalmus rhombeus]